MDYKDLNTDDILNSEEYRSQQKEAEQIARDPDRLADFLSQAEAGLNKIPKVGKLLSNAVILVAMVRSYVKKEYTKLPVASLVAIVAALLYLFSPVDLIPDVIPVIGYLDDAAVLAATLAFIGKDVEEYKAWRDQQG